MGSTLQVNGTRGEITPLMHARVDSDFYQAGYAQSRNVVITRYGPHTRVPGTLVQGLTKFPNRRSRQLPFEFSETQIYSIEFGHKYVRFWTPEGQITTGGTPYELVTVYDEQDLDQLHVRQSGDALYIFCNGYRPTILKRAGETSWSFEPYKAKDGPYDGFNDTATTLRPADTGNVVPRMTANNAPAPVTVSATSAGSVFAAFARGKDAEVVISSTGAGELRVDLGAGNAVVADLYYLISPMNNHYNDGMISQWDLQGSNNATDWVTLDSRDNENGWSGSETRYYQTTNKQAFRYYRLLFSGGGNSVDFKEAKIGGWYMHRAASDQTPSDLVASSTAGINDGVGFLATDVGRSIRLQGSDGIWRWAEITSRTNATTVKVRLNGHAFLNSDPIQNWRMGAWSDTSGWPRTGRFFEDRLALASWPDDPIGLALSASAAYDDFRTSSPVLDDDALNIRMTGGRFDPIYWMAEAGSLLAGTGGGLRSVGGRNSDEVLKNDNIRQRLETSTAASPVQPVQVENVVLFVDRLMRRLYEVAYTYEADGFIAREVSVLNDHLFKRGVQQIDFVDAPYKFVLGRRADGQIIFFAYDREQKIAGGTLVNFQGKVEDLMVMAGRDYPDVWLTVARTRNGVTERYIEKLAPFWDGVLAPEAPPVYAACSYVYSGAPTGALSGLSALRGRTVGVWADGQDVGDAVVTLAGALTIPYDKVASKVVVGERMPFRLQTLRLPTVGQEGGLGKKLRLTHVNVDLFESARVYAGGLKEQTLLRSSDYSEYDPDLPEEILTGILPATVDDSFTDGGVCVIRGDSMYPATIRAIQLDVVGEP